MLSEPIQKEPPDTQPVCPVFGECGGCVYHDLTYAQELKIKEQLIRERVVDVCGLDEKIFRGVVASPSALHYRQRIDLKVQRTRNGVMIGFTPKSGRGILSIDACPIALASINKEIPAIKNTVLRTLPERYIQANITIRSGDDGRVFWGGIGKRSLKMKEEDYLWTDVNGRRIFYAMDTFFQANLSILPRLIGALRSLGCWGPSTHLFDLYGGVGFFSVCLHDLVGQLTLIEEVGASIQCAHYNKNYHRIGNLQIMAGRVEDRALEAIDASSGRKVAIIDPPRAGLSPSARDCIKTAALDDLIYVSCSPDSLANDLKEFITEGWLIKSVTAFDFFPRTKHIETLIVMEKTHGTK